jgi:hypothetical protein
MISLDTKLVGYLSLHHLQRKASSSMNFEWKFDASFLRDGEV